MGGASHQIERSRHRDHHPTDRAPSLATLPAAHANRGARRAPHRGIGQSVDGPRLAPRFPRAHLRRPARRNLSSDGAPPMAPARPADHGRLPRRRCVAPCDADRFAAPEPTGAARAGRGFGSPPAAARMQRAARVTAARPPPQRLLTGLAGRGLWLGVLQFARNALCGRHRPWRRDRHGRRAGLGRGPSWLSVRRGGRWDRTGVGTRQWAGRRQARPAARSRRRG